MTTKVWIKQVISGRIRYLDKSASPVGDIKLVEIVDKPIGYDKVPYSAWVYMFGWPTEYTKGYSDVPYKAVFHLPRGEITYLLEPGTTKMDIANDRVPDKISRGFTHFERTGK